MAQLISSAESSTDISKIVEAPSRVFDRGSREWIHYTSPSDALIARLHLESHIPSRYVNAFLDVLNNPHFSVKQLSFKASADIDKSVAEYRRAEALNRASRTGLSTSHLPYDVFALVVDAITEERLPLRTDDSSCVFGKLPPGQRPSDRIASRLKALALTHRTITPLAQRALGQRIFVHKADDLYALARSPLLGPWTTELIVNLYFATPASGVFSGPDDALHCVVAILRRAPALKFLRIRTPQYFEEGASNCFARLLGTIGALENLETLWMIAPENALHRVDLEDVCHVMPRMPRLRSLVLKNAQCGWTEFDEVDCSLAGLHQLEELSLTDLHCPAGSLENTCLAWLLKMPSLESLTLSTDGGGVQSLLASSPVIPHLHTCRFKLPTLLSHGYLAQVFSVRSEISQSRGGAWAQTPEPKLHTLHLAFDPRRPFLHSFEFEGIPSTLRVLRLGLFQLDVLGVEGKNRCAMQELILLHLLTADEGTKLTLDELDIAVPFQQNYPWNRLREVCEQKGCKFVVRKVMQTGFA